MGALEIIFIIIVMIIIMIKGRFLSTSGTKAVSLKRPEAKNNSQRLFMYSLSQVTQRKGAYRGARGIQCSTVTGKGAAAVYLQRLSIQSLVSRLGLAVRR